MTAEPTLLKAAVPAPALSAAYAQHCAAIQHYYRPDGPIEACLVDQIANGLWRIQRAHDIEEGIFSMDAATRPDADAGPASTWLEQAKTLSLLGTYEGRIRRALDRDKAELAALQSSRKNQTAEAVNHPAPPQKTPTPLPKSAHPLAFPKTSSPTQEFVFSNPPVSIERAIREALTLPKVDVPPGSVR